jgi:hypothetical protein
MRRRDVITPGGRAAYRAGQANARSSRHELPDVRSLRSVPPRMKLSGATTNIPLMDQSKRSLFGTVLRATLARVPSPDIAVSDGERFLFIRLKGDFLR